VREGTTIRQGDLEGLAVSGRGVGECRVAVGDDDSDGKSEEVTVARSRL
jgi:hypothetical protein